MSKISPHLLRENGNPLARSSKLLAIIPNRKTLGTSIKPGDLAASRSHTNGGHPSKRRSRPLPHPYRHQWRMPGGLSALQGRPSLPVGVHVVPDGWAALTATPCHAVRPLPSRERRADSCSASRHTSQKAPNANAPEFWQVPRQPRGVIGTHMHMHTHTQTALEASLACGGSSGYPAYSPPSISLP